MEYLKPKLIGKSEKRSKVSRNIYYIYECGYCGKHFHCLKRTIKTKISCGCMFVQQQRENATKHGGKYTRIYKIYRSMIERCNNINNSSYKNYGARGISVEFESFEYFREWSYENGYSEKLSIDRINNNGNYSPSNCRWTTNAVQQMNKRNNTYYEYKNEKFIAPEICRRYNIGLNTFKSRIRAGWTVEKAIEEPVREKRR